MNDIKNVSVIGGGTMGNGIAHVFAMSGFEVTLVEAKQQFLDKALDAIEKNLDRMLSKQKISNDDKKATLQRIHSTLNTVEGVMKADLVVEAIPEQFDLKKKVFQEVDENAPKHTILASNTSSISITKLAAQTKRPDRFIGMHFFNPVPVMKLVEVINGLETSEETTQTVMGLAEKLGKVPVSADDSPGFVSNRVLMPMINEAIFCVYEGVAEPEDIDQVMKLGMAHPMGPLRLADFIGLDVCLDILNVLYDGFKDPKYRPCPLLVKMVDAGKLGDKTGEGFFKYD
ncbi:3-hydroxybutyryl-CoA dehydrogenase [Rhodohalobacter sp. WB101]|uniref:3-hydroxybutyryl-CoA dehydrogenase n=1 Tax=Rhodohalobacter sulfatireducens TaxID=2911366 RepID=A0ABS9KI94_9BACT|nr:3-hydroxybutyryl-CoA dehydrogenase [Rhodohalobacter sulfatireducens]MCG2590576.1 3-hydroxybutyryl-CoA dehydrogenase [Rhodohalobacter sulfatireducens]